MIRYLESLGAGFGFPTFSGKEWLPLRGSKGHWELYCRDHDKRIYNLRCMEYPDRLLSTGGLVKSAPKSKRDELLRKPNGRSLLHDFEKKFTLDDNSSVKWRIKQLEPGIYSIESCEKPGHYLKARSGASCVLVKSSGADPLERFKFAKCPEKATKSPAPSKTLWATRVEVTHKLIWECHKGTEGIFEDTVEVSTGTETTNPKIETKTAQAISTEAGLKLKMEAEASAKDPLGLASGKARTQMEANMSHKVDYSSVSSFTSGTTTVRKFEKKNTKVKYVSPKEIGTHVYSKVTKITLNDGSQINQFTDAMSTYPAPKQGEFTIWLDRDGKVTKRTNTLFDVLSGADGSADTKV